MDKEKREYARVRGFLPIKYRLLNREEYEKLKIMYLDSDQAAIPSLVSQFKNNNIQIVFFTHCKCG